MEIENLEYNVERFESLEVFEDKIMEQMENVFESNLYIETYEKMEITEKQLKDTDYTIKNWGDKQKILQLSSLLPVSYEKRPGEIQKEPNCFMGFSTQNKDRKLLNEKSAGTLLVRLGKYGKIAIAIKVTDGSLGEVLSYEFYLEQGQLHRKNGFSASGFPEAIKYVAKDVATLGYQNLTLQLFDGYK